MTITRWKNNKATTTVEIYTDEANIPLDICKEQIINELKPYTEPNKEYELVIEFLSSGYDDPGNYYNPPESDEERTLSEIYLEETNTKIQTNIPKTLQEHLFEKYTTQVMDQDIDYYTIDDERADYEFDRWKEDQEDKIAGIGKYG